MKNIRRITAKLLATAVAVVACGSALAQIGGGVVPLAPTFSEFVQNTSGPPITGDGPFEVSNGFASASTGYSPGVGVASLTIASGSGESQQAGASETWSFIVNGPADLAQTLVPVVLSGTGTLMIQKQTNSQDTDSASATFFSPIFGGTFSQEISFTQETFHVNAPAFVTINTVYDITESISGYSLLTGSPVTDLIKAAIDPDVQFGSGFDASAYSIGFSPVAAVPLPASAWLLLGALGGLAAIARMTRADTQAQLS